MSAIFAGRPCSDPKTLYTSCLAASPPIPTEPWWGRANGFDLNTIGRESGKGWLLLTLADLTAIDQLTDHNLVFSGTDANHAITLRSITFLSAQCVTPGMEGDPLAVFLCNVTDRRYHLTRIPIDRAFNISAADGATYLAGTTDGGAPWTWQEIVDELVTAMGETAAEFTLPFTPDSTPENLAFWGGSVWDALNDVLDRIACAPLYDILTDTFSVVRLGVTDAVADAAQLASIGERTWDAYPVDPIRAWRPEKVQVRFLRRPAPTTGTTPYYSVDVTLAVTAGVVTGSYVQLDDDLTALGATGTPTNSAALTTRAAERAADWLRKRTTFSRPLLKVYRDYIPGIVRDVPGATVGECRLDETGGPMRTQIASRPDKRLEDWRALKELPPWFPATAGAAAAATVTSWKHTVRAATTANGTLATAFDNASVIDGVTLATDDRILVKDQSSGGENGIYVVQASGSPVRASDADTGDELVGAVVRVSEGTVNQDTIWECETDASITIGTTATVWRRTFPAPSGAKSIVGGVALTADDTWTDITGQDLVLPRAGTYLIFGTISGRGQLSSGVYGVIKFRVYNVTDSADALTQMYGALTDPGDFWTVVEATTTSVHSGTSGLGFVYIASASKTLRLQGKRVGGPTWSFATLGIPVGNWGYLRIG